MFRLSSTVFATRRDSASSHSISSNVKVLVASVRLRVMRSHGLAWGGVVLGLGLAFSAACGSTSAPGNAAGAGSATGGGGNQAGSSFAGKSAAGSESHAGTSSSGQGGASVAGGGARSEAGAAGGGGQPGGAGSASGGAGESAGGASPEVTAAECDTDDDCQVVNDCCTCAAQPKSEQQVACPGLCIQSACQARGLADAKAKCVGNRCVFDVSCNRAQVTCEAAVPTCPAGPLPSVNGTCWGSCLPAHDCQEVTNCNDCSASQLCVRNELQLPSTRCVEASASCVQHPNCECANACDFQCSDETGIACYCPTSARRSKRR